MIGIISAGLGLLGSGMSIIESIEAKKRQRDADKAADIALRQAKKELSVNRMEGIQVPIESYNQAMRAVTAQQMQAVEGLRESGQRAVAGGIGRVGAVGQDAVEQYRQQMDKALAQRDLLIAQEDARIDQSLAEISLGEAKGAMAASQQNQQVAAQQMTSAVSGLGAVANNLYKYSDLYKKTDDDTTQNNDDNTQVNNDTTQVNNDKTQPIRKESLNAYGVKGFINNDRQKYLNPPF